MNAPHSRPFSLLAAIRSIASYFAVSLYVLVVGPPILLLTVIIRSPRSMYAAGKLGLHLGLGLAGVTFEVRGREHILRDRAAVYAVNHSSNLEPPVVFAALADLFPKLRVLYKAELRKLPVLVWVFDIAGFVPLQRANPDQSLPAVDRAVEALRAGNSFLIFPEGTRSRTGQLLPFKKGGFVMAIKAQAPVVPVAISGAQNAMRKGSLFIQPVHIVVQFAPPVPTAGLVFDDRDRVVAAVRDGIVGLLAVLN